MNIHHSIELGIINQRLLGLYGRAIDSDQANFRVVHSEGIYEKRKTEIWETDAGIYLREPIIKVKELPKYMYLHDCFIIERLIPNLHKDVIVEGSYSYEPLFAFYPGEPFNWIMVKKVIKAALESKGKRKGNYPKSEKECIELETALRAKRKADTLEVLKRSDVEDALHFGEAVSLAGLDIPQAKENNE